MTSTETTYETPTSAWSGESSRRRLQAQVLRRWEAGLKTGDEKKPAAHEGFWADQRVGYHAFEGPIA